MEIIDDLRKIRNLDQAVFSKTISCLSARYGDDVEKAAAFKSVSDDTDIECLSRFLDFLGDNLIEARDFHKKLNQIDNFISSLVSGDIEAFEGWNRIKDSLDSLTQVFLLKKENGLKSRFKGIIGFEVTTDIRPLFSLDRQKIEKTLIASILKIQTTDDDEFICEFYDDAIDDLIQELERTKAKIKILREHYGRL